MTEENTKDTLPTQSSTAQDISPVQKTNRRTLPKMIIPLVIIVLLFLALGYKYLADSASKEDIAPTPVPTQAPTPTASPTPTPTAAPVIYSDPTPDPNDPNDGIEVLDVEINGQHSKP